MTPDVKREIFTAAVKEMGYEIWTWQDADADGGPYISFDPEPPRAVMWQAGNLAGLTKSCWACADDTTTVARDCADGNCHHPEGPARPPRELLRARP